MGLTETIQCEDRRTGTDSLLFSPHSRLTTPRLLEGKGLTTSRADRGRMKCTTKGAPVIQTKPMGMTATTDSTRSMMTAWTRSSPEPVAIIVILMRETMRAVVKARRRGDNSGDTQEDSHDRDAIGSLSRFSSCGALSFGLNYRQHLGRKIFIQQLLALPHT